MADPVPQRPSLPRPKPPISQTPRLRDLSFPTTTKPVLKSGAA